MTKELVATERLRILEEVVSNQKVQITTTQGNTVNLNQENERFGLAGCATGTRGTSGNPEAKPSPQQTMRGAHEAEGHFWHR